MRKGFLVIDILFVIFLGLAISPEIQKPEVTEQEYTPENIVGNTTVDTLYVAENENRLSDLDYDFLVRCVMAEAGNQGYQGQRLVCSVILNRVESSKFPDSVYAVVTQPHQFSCYSDGGMNRHKPTEETFKACEDELKERTNTDLLYFRTGHYGYGTPVFKYKDHYFSR